MPTTFMNLTLPTVSTTIGPQWAETLNAALNVVDTHDHSSGKGQKITQAGINITGTLELNNQKLTEVQESTYQNLSALSSTVNTVYVRSGDLYFNDSGANQIRLTAGGALNVGSIGGIGGDYGSTSATAFYTDASLTYFFQDSSSNPAKLDIGDLDCADIVADSIGSVSSPVPLGNIDTLTVNTNIISPAATITTIAGAGTVPLGAIIPIAANLTGAMSIPASGTIDSNGFQYCDGAAIAGAATMSGTIPNLTGSIFLMGSTSAGSTGGNNSSAHTHTVADHSHTFAHTHGTDSQLGTITLAHSHTVDSHTHNMEHVHQFMYSDAGSFTAHQGANSSNAAFTTGISKYSTIQTIGYQSGSTFSTLTTFVNTNDQYFTTGTLNNSAALITNTGSASPGTNPQLSNYNAAHTHSTTSQSTSTTGLAGSQTSSGASATENRPNYISVVYVMRVK